MLCDDVVFQCDQRVYVGKCLLLSRKGSCTSGTYHNSLVCSSWSCPDEVLAGLFSWQMNDGRTRGSVHVEDDVVRERV